MAEPTDRESPTEDEIFAQLERILASPAFPASERRGSLLRYLVDETLAGRGNFLKGYAIATAVLDRGPDRLGGREQLGGGGDHGGRHRERRIGDPVEPLQHRVDLAWVAADRDPAELDLGQAGALGQPAEGAAEPIDRGGA